MRRSVLENISKEMMNIRQRLDDIEKCFAGWNPQPVKITESQLIALPDQDKDKEEGVN
ncbi:MAG: hypothetical protein ABSE15_00250 [Candidatus Bathyarchaeia archaeon]|jgi:hypothetical protein